MEGLASKTIISLFFIVIFRANNATISNLRTLNIQHCNQTDFNKIEDAVGVTELLANACNLTKLENNIFAGFESLSVLQIAYSQVETLKKSSLYGLKRLRVLSLAGNNISTIQNWSPEPLIALNTLDLRRNKIKSLRNNSFECYPNLQSLDLSENILENLNGYAFTKLPYFKNLNLTGNRLRFLNSSTFEGLERLAHLNLKRNEIKEIPSTTFESNLHLQTLNLEHNKLKNLQFLKAKNLERLLLLNLTQNLLTQIEPNTFEHNYGLISLDLSWNSLTKLANNSFTGLRSLEHLNVSNNRLNSIEPLCFGELRGLKQIKLSHNNLSTISPILFETTPLLVHVDLSQNKLATISETLFSPLPNLMHINVAGNKLSNGTFIAHFATALQHTELTLDLSDNLFEHTTLNMTKLAEFGRVELAGNHWSCLWLISGMATLPTSLHFERNYEVPVDVWSNAIIDLTGTECYDDQRKRSIIILQTVCSQLNSTDERKNLSSVNSCTEKTLVPQNLSPPPLVWPKIRMDKFDSRSVIIWMLIAIAIAFAGLRVARHLMDAKDKRRLFRRFKHQQSNCTEMEALHSSGGSSSGNRTPNKQKT